MPALQACSLRRAFVLQVHVAQGEELVGRRPRHRVHEKREVARLRQSSLAALAHVHRQERADAVAVRCLQEGAPHGKSSSEEKHRWRQTPPRTQLVPRHETSKPPARARRCCQ